MKEQHDGDTNRGEEGDERERERALHSNSACKGVMILVGLDHGTGVRATQYCGRRQRADHAPKLGVR